MPRCLFILGLLPYHAQVMVTRASLLSAAGVSVEGDGYSCVAADLRDLPSLSHSLQAALSPTPLNGPVPTLFVLESVLGYLQPHEAQGLLRYAALGPCHHMTIRVSTEASSLSSTVLSMGIVGPGGRRSNVAA